MYVGIQSIHSETQSLQINHIVVIRFGNDKSAQMHMAYKCQSIIFFELLLLLTLLPSPEKSILLFARRYKVRSTMYHVAIPKLNSFGETFAGNGYQVPGEDLKE